MNICPFCCVLVHPDNPHWLVINNSGTVAHDYCLEEAKRNARKDQDNERVSSLQNPRKRLDDGNG